MESKNTPIDQPIDQRKTKGEFKMYIENYENEKTTYQNVWDIKKK